MLNEEIYDKYVKQKRAKFIYTLESNFQRKLDYSEDIIRQLHYLYFCNDCNFDIYYFIEISKYLNMENFDCSYILEFILENYYEVPYSLEYNENYYICDDEDSYITENKNDVEKINNLGGVLYRI